MKKGLKKIVLVSKVPKAKILSKEVTETKKELDLSQLENAFQEHDKLEENYFFIKDVIRDIFYNIINFNGTYLDKIRKSMDVNGFIKEYKFDRDIHNKLKEDIKPIFYPMLNGNSKYLSIYFKKSLIDIILEVKEESISFDGYENFVLNEIHNILNYRKTSVTLMDKETFDKVHDMFLEIKNEFTEHFILNNKLTYFKDDFKLEPFDVLEDGVEYKLLYVVPNKTYGDKKYSLSKANPRCIMAPVLFNTKGEPISLKLWNAIATLNESYKLEIPVKCLVPVDVKLNHKVISMNNKILIQCFNRLGCFKETLNRKVSLLLFSMTETYYGRKLLKK